jgi:hypothetical protein
VGGQGGDVRLAVAGQGNEGDVLATGALDGAAADDALPVGEQHDLEQHGGWKGTRAGGVVLEPCVKAGQVDLVIEQVIQGAKVPGINCRCRSTARKRGLVSICL